MSLSKQSKTLNRNQIALVRRHLEDGRNPTRNVVMFLMSIRAGLRAKEIAEMKWIYLVDATGDIDDTIRLPDIASKGRSGREIPIHPELKEALRELYETRRSHKKFDIEENVIRTERSPNTSSQVVVNFFSNLYKDLGLVGCSSHSGRRTFITETARKISSVGGSLRDIQYLAGHSSLQTTQRYIEGSAQSKVRVIALL